MAFNDDVERINTLLRQTHEFRRLQEEADEFPLQYFYDMRASIKRVRLEGTHLEENELFDLRRSLETIGGIVRFLSRGSDEGVYDFPTLHDLTEGVLTFPDLLRRIDQILEVDALKPVGQRAVHEGNGDRKVRAHQNPRRAHDRQRIARVDL